MPARSTPPPATPNPRQRVGIRSRRIGFSTSTSPAVAMMSPEYTIAEPNMSTPPRRTQRRTPSGVDVQNAFNSTTEIGRPNDQAHRRQWSAAELPSGAAPCYVGLKTMGEIGFIDSMFNKLHCSFNIKVINFRVFQCQVY